jgi:TRAP-type uncharacterized transport system substrate-binding protein
MHSLTSHAPRVTRIAALLLLGTVQAWAQDGPSDCSLRVASGPKDKVYARMVEDMKSVCGAAVSVCSVDSTGGLQNLSLLSDNGADLGIVQIDTLQDMSAGDENIQTLQAVMPLHVNLLHVIALASGSLVDVKMVAGAVVPFTGHKVVIRKFSELKGMTVAAVGSAQLMGQTLEKRLGYGMTFVVADDDEALKLLRTGKVQAVFTLGGSPLPAVTRHRLDSGLQLVDFDLAFQRPYMTVKKNYANLGAYNLNFLGVPNLLVTRPFRSGGAMANRVSTLGACLRQHLDELQEGQKFKPGWKEIKDPDEVYGVRRFAIVPPVGIARSKNRERSSSARSQ